MAERFNSAIPRRQRVFAVLCKVIALLGLVALSVLLMRPTGNWSIGWVVFIVAVIQVCLDYSPRESATNRAAVPVRSTECRRYRYRANNPYPCRRLRGKD